MFSDILSGILSNILCGILSDTVFDVLKFAWSSIWNPIWHSIWHFVWHSDSLFGIVFGPATGRVFFCRGAETWPFWLKLRSGWVKTPEAEAVSGWRMVSVGRGRSSTLEPRLAGRFNHLAWDDTPKSLVFFSRLKPSIWGITWNYCIHFGYDTAHLWIYHWCISAPDNIMDPSSWGDAKEPDSPRHCEEIPLENAGPWRKTRSFPAESGMIHADSIGIPAARLFCLKI